ncbi:MULTISPECIES: arsenic resistance protein [unclassified Halomonas]|uniref:arsenic resistance protein n=1 Tax=unclassified Halomonas TaxID=2609666 RepID=UPI0007D9C6CD|nr:MULTISPECIES: arsenic resistance protein [unclassified Halomonas]MBT2785077.1 arsenic resistance protein [Halomonas sp. ISL-106]MBT2796771.1 arsenic resistance protein [Halomonas sp. ISL-104]OAL59999.1 bile acid:sodium symporter [Halomonas sp. ALS9]
MRDQLEQQQSWIYLGFICLGLALGSGLPALSATLQQLLWPLLGLLLYVTFTQIPLLHIAQSMKDKRFMAALMVGNFIAIPAFLALLVVWLPLSPPVLAGVLLVLLVPCTDWFITFTHLGKGDTARAVAATPLLLLVQMIALPVYLWLFLGSEWFQLTLSTELLRAFAGLILTPLALAWLTEYAAQRHKAVERSVHKLGLLPVPLLALVVFIIAASQIKTVLGLSQVLVQVVFIFIGFLLFAALLGKGLGKLFKLPTTSARTLAFSFGTRNSFVMLPIALTLPSAWQAAVVVIVFQSLVELFGMVAFLRWVPSKLLPKP